MNFENLKKMVKENFALEELDNIPESDSTINISAIELSATQKVVISISRFKDKLFFDMRHWYRQEAGNWIPSKKGIHLPLEKSFAISDIIEKIKQFSN